MKVFGYLAIGIFLISVGVGLLSNPYNNITIGFGIFNILLGLGAIGVSIVEFKKIWK